MFLIWSGQTIQEAERVRERERVMEWQDEKYCVGLRVLERLDADHKLVRLGQ